MKKFKITIMQQLRMLAHMLLIYPVIFVGYYLKVDDFNNFLTSGTLYIIIPFFLIIDILPTLILHIQYLIKNHHAILSIDTNQKVITYSSPKKNITNPLHEIKSLIYFNNYGVLYRIHFTYLGLNYVNCNQHESIKDRGKLLSMKQVLR